MPFGIECIEISLTMYSSEEENVEIVESIAHPERQILQEGNQVEVLPKWDLKPVYCNLI